MNSTTPQTPVLRSRSRSGASTILLSLFLSFNLLPVSAQNYQKHITTVWTATSAAGSTVHVVSNTAVNDYEAYTRGGRFYVKIPAADLPSARGSLLGRGFDDVQIQRYGNGIIISFHLLPGTSARVQQGGNNLDVVFTSIGKTASPAAGSVDESNRVRPRRLVDGAGPNPESVASDRTGQRSNRGGYGSGTPKKNDGRTSTSNKPVADNYESPKPSPKPSPSKEVAAASPRPSATPYASPSPVVAVASPVTSPSPNSVVGSSSPTSRYSPYQQPSVASTPATDSKTEGSDWAGRLNYLKLWVQLNWIPILVGSLILVSLLVLAFFWRGLQRVKAAAVEPSEPPDSSETVRPETNNPALENPVPERSNAASAAAGYGSSASSGFSESQPATTAPTEDNKDKGADPDREVFEL